jgi:plasmid segregation protein ParM
MSVIRAIEIGYGTTSFTKGIKNGNPIVETFSSNVALKNGSDLSGGLSRKNTIDIEIDGDVYEVGPDAHLLTDRTTSRALTNKYIDTQQYKALFKGALAMMGEATIDLLVLALPVNNMKRTDELKRFAIGTHRVGNQSITVKDVWVLCQPLAGFLSYANTLGQDGFNELSESNVLCLDFGYSTADWLVTRGLKINYKKSGAVNMGMSTILETCVEHLSQVEGFKHLDDITFDLVDAAFFKHKGKLKISGKAYEFPVHDDKNGVSYDCESVIKQITSNCLQEVRNSVGAGADIEKIIVMGGGHQAYLSAIKENYAHHEIVVVDDPLTAVCTGMYFGGIQFFQLKSKQEQVNKRVA